MTKAPPCPTPPATTRLRGVEAALLPLPASHPQGHRPPCSSPQPAEGKAAGSREGTWGEVWWQGTLEEATGVSWLWPEPPQRTSLGAQAAHRLWGCWGGTGRAGGTQGPLPPPCGKGSVKSFGTVGFALLLGATWVPVTLVCLLCCTSPEGPQRVSNKAWECQVPTLKKGGWRSGKWWGDLLGNYHIQLRCAVKKIKVSRGFSVINTGFTVTQNKNETSKTVRSNT